MNFVSKLAHTHTHTHTQERNKDINPLYIYTI